ncbi:MULTISPECIES: hypothetical protein [Aphanothece]|uniref:hypothetical protein n=1 Tax=Aphanothece TaxID=1121 RepID=UPI00398E6C2A
MRPAHPGFPAVRRGRVLAGLIVVAMAGAGALSASPAGACERHLDGHQSGSQTQSEVMGGR